MSDIHRVFDKLLISNKSLVDGTEFNLDLDTILSLINSTEPYELKGNYLLPPRLPAYIKLADTLTSLWPAIKKHALEQGPSMLPAAKHILLSLILTIDDVVTKKTMLADIMPVLSLGAVYQPTITCASILSPDIFDKFQKFSVSIKGGNIMDSDKGVTCSVIASVDKLKINPVDLFTSDKIISAEQALAIEPTSLAALTNSISEIDYLPVTSTWIYGLIQDISVCWDRIPIGAALYSPFFNQRDINDRYSNLLADKGAGFFTRPGDGISDILPLNMDDLLTNFIKIDSLYDAPFTINNLCSLKHCLSSERSATTLSIEWLTAIKNKIDLADSLDLLPEYSAFKKDTVMTAMNLLIDTKELKYFDAFFSAILTEQTLANTKYQGIYIDVCNTGLPEDFKHYQRMSNTNTPVPMETSI